MRKAAIRQAQELAERSNLQTVVYLQPHPGLPLWYVRTINEPKPDGATIEYTCWPGGLQPTNEEG